MNTKVYPNGLSGQITIPAADSIAVRSFGGNVQVYQVVGYPNVPATKTKLADVLDGTETVYGPYASGTIIEIEAAEGGAEYAVGVGPKVGLGFYGLQGAPGTLNATGALTTALILTGIVTSTTAAAVAATLDTGTVLDAAVQMSIGDSFDWSVINTGPNTFTVTAAADHTVVGTGVAVLTGTSAMFRTRKTAANTFVTYCIG